MLYRPTRAVELAAAIAPEALKTDASVRAFQGVQVARSWTDGTRSNTGTEPVSEAEATLGKDIRVPRSKRRRAVAPPLERLVAEVVTIARSLGKQRVACGIALAMISAFDRPPRGRPASPLDPARRKERDHARSGLHGRLPRPATTP